MSRSDFEACTPSEFSAVASKWGTWREGIERAEWERMREVAMRFASAAAAPSEDRVEAYKGRNDQGAAQDSADNPDGIQEEKFPKAI